MEGENHCSVCSAGDSKYKCPRCLQKYCSVDCGRIHAETCIDDEKECTLFQGSVSPEKSVAAEPQEEAELNPIGPLNQEQLNRILSDPRVNEMISNPDIWEEIRHVATGDPNRPSGILEEFSSGSDDFRDLLAILVNLIEKETA